MPSSSSAGLSGPAGHLGDSDIAESPECADQLGAHSHHEHAARSSSHGTVRPGGSVPATRPSAVASSDLIIMMLVLIAVVLWLGLWGIGFTSDLLQLVAASVICCLLGLLGVRRSSALLGRLDPFHPLVFPLGYVLVSFLAPAWATFVADHAVGSLSRKTSLATDTPLLLCLGVAGFATGAAIAFPTPHRPALSNGPPADGQAPVASAPRPAKRAARRAASIEEEGRSQRRVLGRTMLTFGRFLAGAALILVVYQMTRGGVLVRGLDQTQYSLSDSVAVLTKLLPLAAVALVCAGSAVLEYRKVLARIDALLFLLVILGVGILGSRNTAIAVLLMILFNYTRRAAKVRWGVIIVGFFAAVLLVLVVLDYRNSVRGIQTDKAWWATLLGDLAPAAFSVGAVAAAVPSTMPYAMGSTMIAALVRQLPGPIAVALFGEPTQTGSRIFRDIAGITNVNAGVGFSIPAEGYLNFGLFGLIAVCFLLGLGLALFYARNDLSSGKVSGMIYIVLIGVLPMALRSDFLGAIKLVLYPALLMSLAVLVGRSMKATMRARSRRAHHRRSHFVYAARRSE